MVNAPESFSTARLLLRRPCLADAAAIFEYVSDPLAVHYMDYPVCTHVDDIVKRLQDNPAQWNTGSFSWVITIQPDDRPVGLVACWINHPTAGFGYLLNRHYWGRGYGTEAARAVVNWAIAQPDIKRVWATCDAENLASVRVLEKCGLSFESRLPGYAVRPNISPLPRDTLMYARVNQDANYSTPASP
ncbi:MAG: GNAT family N-acetyltransferase [Cyanobacteria bacterium J06638_6]